MKNLFYLVLVFLTLASSANAQSNSAAGGDQTQLDDLIGRFDSDSDYALSCRAAVDAFSEEFKKAPNNPYAALYLGRSYDHLASIGGYCPYPNSLFLMYSDSTLYYYRLADRLQPGIKEKKFNFVVPNMIGHLFGSRCLWYMKKGRFDEARKELAKGMSEGGFAPAQIEYCRLMLDYCDSNSIFFPCGDDDTFPTMYLQMVEGYRPDVSVVNASLLSMSWYLKMFLGKNHPRIKPVAVTMTDKEIDTLENPEYVATVPDRIYTEIDGEARTRIQKELGIDGLEKAEICFPFYERSSRGSKELYYTFGAQKAIASILLANKWKRHIYFGSGGLDGFLKCTHVAVRKGGLIDELYPITTEQAEHFMNGGKWFDQKKMKSLYLSDVKMPKFMQNQNNSNGQMMIYYVLSEYLSLLGPKDGAADKIYAMIKSIPRQYLEGYEQGVLSAVQYLYNGGFKKEAHDESMSILPFIEKKISSPRTSITSDDNDYLYALLFAGECNRAETFINSFDIPKNTKAEYLRVIREGYGCN